MKLSDKVIKPRCPNCGKVQADWVKEAQFTCSRCHITFTIMPFDKLRVLTNSENSGSLEISKT